MRKPRHKPKSIPPNLPVLVRSDGHEVALPEDIVAAAKEHATKARAPATLKAYGVWLRDFQGWCEAHGRDAYPANPATVTGYVTALAARGLSISTIDQAVAAIKFAQRAQGYVFDSDSQLLKDVLRGIRRGIAQKRTIRKVKPLSSEIIRDLLDSLDPADPTQARDRAAISLGFAAALRRSELVTLDWERFGGHEHSKGFVLADDRGLIITLMTSKASQDAAQEKVVPYNDAPRTWKAVSEWVKLARIAPGEPLFPGGFTSGGYQGEVYKGVSRVAREQQVRGKPWRAQIRRTDVGPNSKAYRHLGYYATQEEAVAVYVAAGGVREVRPRAPRINAQTIATAIKTRVAAYLEKDMGKKKRLKPEERKALSALYSGHSMRAGHVSDAFERGMSIARIKAMTGHRSDGMVLGYGRQAEKFKKSSLEGAGV